MSVCPQMHTICLQISYASSSSALSDRSRFKSFFRNTFNIQIIAPALRSAMVHFNWLRIAILTQDEGSFIEVSTVHDEVVHLFVCTCM